MSAPERVGAWPDGAARLAGEPLSTESRTGGPMLRQTSATTAANRPEREVVTEPQRVVGAERVHEAGPRQAGPPQAIGAAAGTEAPVVAVTETAPVAGAPAAATAVAATPATAPRPGPARRMLDLSLAASGWVLLGLDVAHGPVPVRLALVLAFVGLAPGLALRRFLPAASRLEMLCFALATSFSLTVFVTLGLALAHVETTVRALEILAGITSLAALADAVLRVPPRAEAASDPAQLSARRDSREAAGLGGEPATGRERH